MNERRDDSAQSETVPPDAESAADDFLPDGEDGALASLLGKDIADLLAEKDRVADPDQAPADDIADGQLPDLLDEVFTRGRRLERLGDCVLAVDDDGMTAFFKGVMPEGTGFKDVVELIERAGIRFGLIKNRIYDVLPRKVSQRKRERRGLKKDNERASVTVVAEGRPPVPPPPSRVEYLFGSPEADDVSQVGKILAEYDATAIKRCRVSMPLVQAGQVLAEIQQETGKNGIDVFGETVAAEPPEALQLLVGDNVEVDAEGRRLTAAVCGYAGVVDDLVVVVPPLWISRDLMRAFFVHLPQKGACDAPEADDIVEALVQSGIEDEAMLPNEIAALCRCLRRGQTPKRLTLVARGQDAVSARDAQWEYVCAPELTKYYGEINRILQNSPNVEYLGDYSEGLGGKAVSPGERLAVKGSPAPGRPGRDVFGEEFMPEEPREETLEIGRHVRLNADGTACYAKIYGYLGIDLKHNRIEVAPPVWISPDRMEAYYLNLSLLGDERAPAATDIEQLLSLAGVTAGISGKAIKVLCERMRQGISTPSVVPLARGQKPQPGQDGAVAFCIDRAAGPGDLREDGSIDFRQLNSILLLDEGQRICTVSPPTRGVPGKDVCGSDLAVENGRPLSVDSGRNVRLVSRPGRPDEYYAEIQGQLIAVEDLGQEPPVVRLEVLQVLQVPGDVDYSTGHIDYPGCVEIAGSIKAGFKVEAEGNVSVGDSVEDGAVVKAGGHVAIQHGINGEQALVRATGSVYAKYVNKARIQAKADIRVSEYAFNAHIQAGACVLLPGQDGSGVIAGGTTMARSRICAGEIGSQSASPAQLVAGVDLVLLKQAADLQRGLDRYQAGIGKILQLLQVERMASDQVRKFLLKMMLKAKGAKKQRLGQTLKALVKLQSLRDKTLKKKAELDEHMDRLAQQASIEITRQTVRNTAVKLGGYAYTITAAAEAMAMVKFTLAKAKNGKLQVEMTAA